MNVRVKDLIIKAFFRIEVTEGLQKNLEEVIESIADQGLELELLSMHQIMDSSTLLAIPLWPSLREV
jgi:hypothetical protein